MTTMEDMPSAAWFAALPEDRKAKAIRGSYLWKLTEDQERLWGKLGPHADHSDSLTVNRVYVNVVLNVDPTVAKMLDRVPDMLMEGFVLFASSVLLDSLEEMARVCRKYAPDALREVAEERERLAPYLDDASSTALGRSLLAGRDSEARALEAQGDRKKLWVALQATLETDPEAATEIEKAWRMNARAEYILRETLKATAGDF